MRSVIVLITLILVGSLNANLLGQVNMKPLESKGFEVKHKLKPYKKTKNQVLKLKVKNATEDNQNLKFQLYLYVNGTAESMSEQKEVCLLPNKKAKYRFLFEPENTGNMTVEFEKLTVVKVDNCEKAE